MYICADNPPGISVHFERDEIFVLSLSPHSAAAAFWQGKAGGSRRNLWSGEGRRGAAASRCQKGPRTKIAFPAVHKLRIPRKGFFISFLSTCGIGCTFLSFPYTQQCRTDGASHGRRRVACRPPRVQTLAPPCNQPPPPPSELKRGKVLREESTRQGGRRSGEILAAKLEKNQNIFSESCVLALCLWIDWRPEIGMAFLAILVLPLPPQLASGDMQRVSTVRSIWHNGAEGERHMRKAQKARKVPPSLPHKY